MSSLARTTPEPSALLELLKPVTWFPPIWAFTCGVISTGIPVGNHWRAVITGALVAGPLVCGASQAVNDWYDRHVDAINEPKRPIPSGRVPGRWGFYVAIGWSLLSAAVASTLGGRALLATLLGLAMAWMYSMPPFRLKENGWWGNLAVGLSYEGLAWITGTAVMLDSLAPAPPTIWMAVLYSLAAHGIMTLNDFKAIGGDIQCGVRSLPVQLGVTRAAWVSSGVMLAPQFVVAGLLGMWGKPAAALGIVGLIAAQMIMMRWFIAKPVERALYMSAFGVPIEVAGMVLSAFAIRGVA
jgi:chlorophyll synthase